MSRHQPEDESWPNIRPGDFGTTGPVSARPDLREAMGRLQIEHQRRLDQSLESERELVALLGQAEKSIATLARERDLAHSTIEKLADKLDPWITDDDVAVDALVLEAVDRLVRASDEIRLLREILERVTERAEMVLALGDEWGWEAAPSFRNEIDNLAEEVAAAKGVLCAGRCGCHA